MECIDSKPKWNDYYYDLNNLSKKIWDSLPESLRETQKTIKDYTPKPYGSKKTYSRDWSLYEKACSQEKLMFFKILKDAVDYLMIDYKYQGHGRPSAYHADIVKSLCIKTYSQYSSWIAESELKIAQTMGVIDEVYKRSTLNKYMQNKKVTEILNRLYKVIAYPLSEVEMYFAADATGISNKYGNVRWSKIRHTKQEFKKRREFSKLNIISGTKSNIICIARITKGTTHESPYLKEMLQEAAKDFNIKQVSADAGYLAKNNVKAIADIGAIPFIKPKKNTSIPRRGPISAWGAMLRLWKDNQILFSQHYNRRQNVESTIGALKIKFGNFCRSKKPESQKNEILCKIVCFNATILSKALLTYDLNTGFIATL